MENSLRFLKGFLAGAIGTLVVGLTTLLLLSHWQIVELPPGHSADPVAWFGWAFHNLGWSIPVFVLLLIAFALTLVRLKKNLERDAPINAIVQLDQLADTWTTLFFGTGVIWTAIGMRSALIYALGDKDVAMSTGAFAMLERLIDGGILLALSTTIVGGAGGYLMRVYKTMSIGSDLMRRYDQAARADTTEMRDSLKRIEKHLASGSEAAEETLP
ncbi:MAG: hypothetical protein QNJ05_11645 [Woeseiaceae bacterium]|nr:hypothetical protein [Woeseiaceae bacterium]